MTIEQKALTAPIGRQGINGAAPQDGVGREIRASQHVADLVENLTVKVIHLQIALDSNRRIGMAMGIVMHQLHLDDSQAFDALRRISQNSNRKLRDVAEDVIRNRGI